MATNACSARCSKLRLIAGNATLLETPVIGGRAIFQREAEQNLLGHQATAQVLLKN
jgi:hypothetical protein